MTHEVKELARRLNALAAHIREPLAKPDGQDARTCNEAAAALTRQEEEIAALRRVMSGILASQNTGPPYRSWAMSKLSAAAEEARSLLGLPSAIDAMTAKMITRAKASRQARGDTHDGEG